LKEHNKVGAKVMQ